MSVAQFFPRPQRPSQYIDTFCHFDEALKRHLVCSEFFFAKLKNEIIPNKFLGTWVIPDSPQRDMPWHSKYYAGERGNYEDHSGEPYARWDCCFCGGETEPIPAPRIAEV